MFNAKLVPGLLSEYGAEFGTKRIARETTRKNAKEKRNICRFLFFALFRVVSRAILLKIKFAAKSNKLFAQSSFEKINHALVVGFGLFERGIGQAVA